MDLLHEFEKEQVKDVDRPQLKAGDIVRVEMKVTEGEKTRLQIFEGTVIGIRGGGPSVTFTVRRETGRFGVERVFPLYNPLITKIEIVKRQKIRRAKLNYLREAGRRRVKEDEKAMQRHMHEEDDKKRLAEAAKKKKDDSEAKAERARKPLEGAEREKQKKVMTEKKAEADKDIAAEQVVEAPKDEDSPEISSETSEDK